MPENSSRLARSEEVNTKIDELVKVRNSIAGLSALSNDCEIF